MGEKASFRTSIYIILKRDGKILLQRRKGTKLWCDFLALPAGHIDVGENPYEAIIREAREELGMEITEEQIINPQIIQRNWIDAQMQYFDIYFDLINCQEEPKIMEPEKCSELIWVDENNLPKDIIPFEKEALEKRKEGIKFFVTTCNQEEDIQNSKK